MRYVGNLSESYAAHYTDRKYRIFRDWQPDDITE